MDIAYSQKGMPTVATIFQSSTHVTYTRNSSQNKVHGQTQIQEAGKYISPTMRSWQGYGYKILGQSTEELGPDV